MPPKTRKTKTSLNLDSEKDEPLSKKAKPCEDRLILIQHW